MFAYVGLPQNLKDLKDRTLHADSSAPNTKRRYFYPEHRNSKPCTPHPPTPVRAGLDAEGGPSPSLEMGGGWRGRTESEGETEKERGGEGEGERGRGGNKGINGERPGAPGAVRGQPRERDTESVCVIQGFGSTVALHRVCLARACLPVGKDAYVVPARALRVEGLGLEVDGLRSRGWVFGFGVQGLNSELARAGLGTSPGGQKPSGFQPQAADPNHSTPPPSNPKGQAYQAGSRPEGNWQPPPAGRGGGRRRPGQGE